MRVLHVDSGRDLRGGQAQALYLISGLMRRGYEVMLASPRDSALAARARNAGCPVHPVPFRGDLDGGSLLTLRGICAAQRPQIVHAHTARAHAVGVAAARLAGVPCRVVTRRSAPRRVPTLFTRAKYGSGVSRYIAISRQVAAGLARNGVDPERISVVYSGVELAGVADRDDPGRRQAARADLGLGADEMVVACVGALSREKGPDRLLQVFADSRLTGRLVFVGDGPLLSGLRRQAGRLGVAARVLFSGYRNDLAALWAAFDVVAAPSREEGLGTAVIEAMGAGLPIVATRAGGLPETVIDGVCGVLVPPDDGAALGAALSRLMNDAALRRRMGEAGRRRAREFSVERMVNGTERVYRDLAAGRARSPKAQGVAEGTGG